MFIRNAVLSAIAVSMVATTSVALCDGRNVPERKVQAVDFTATPTPTTDKDRLRTHTTSEAIVRYDDGSTETLPLAYNILFTNTDKVAGSEHAAAQLYDVTGAPIFDLNGDPVIAETPDANSLLDVDGKLFLVTHYEYDWLLANGQQANMVEGWYSRMPMSMTLTAIEQNTDGKLAPTAQRPIDFSGVNGLWIPCFGSQTPWNTHLGSEEDYDLYFVEASGRENLTKTTRGLKALTEVYFKGERQANPYDYGYITEVAVEADGSTKVTKHYSMGRGTWEQSLIMPDRRTVYFGDDGANVGLFLFVTDTAGDLSAGTRYAARWEQTSADGVGTAKLHWVKLGHATSDDVRGLIDGGIAFDDIFESTTLEASPDWKEKGFRMISAGHMGNELLKLKPGMEQAAAFLEGRRYAAYLGATTEFNKMEGAALDPRDKHLYLAMSYIEKGMQKNADAPADHIQVNKLKAGAVYRIALAGGRKDVNGEVIDSDWVGTAMSAPAKLTGEDIPADALGNIADPDKIANPDNLFFSDKMRTLFVGEDSGTHVNNALWAYNVDTDKLTRILSLASGAESTGLQVVENINGHAYIMSNAQHQGEWIKTMPSNVKARLSAAAAAAHGKNAKGALSYQLQAPVGYISGIPGL
ncbi:MAG: DUF839 domain-containing protein [Thiohalocapsa sp.]|jgi:hypothetical protein